jgi:hypothetical protein
MGCVRRRQGGACGVCLECVLAAPPEAPLPPAPAPPGASNPLTSTPLAATALASFSSVSANLLKYLTASEMSSSWTKTHAFSPMQPFSATVLQPSTCSQALRIREFLVTVTLLFSGRPLRNRCTVGTCECLDGAGHSKGLVMVMIWVLCWRAAAVGRQRCRCICNAHGLQPCVQQRLSGLRIPCHLLSAAAPPSLARAARRPHHRSLAAAPPPLDALPRPRRTPIGGKPIPLHLSRTHSGLQTHVQALEAHAEDNDTVPELLLQVCHNLLLPLPRECIAHLHRTGRECGLGRGSWAWQDKWGAAWQAAATHTPLPQGLTCRDARLGRPLVKALGLTLLLLPANCRLLACCSIWGAVLAAVVCAAL